MSAKPDPQEARIRSIVGDGGDFKRGLGQFCEHLRTHLKLPLDVIGSEDLRSS